MHVDIAKILHVLAHELRTPSGIAQGYLRMLLEERLVEPADRRRALEQAQKALARVSELTHESTRLANWIEGEGERTEATSIEAEDLITRGIAAAGVEPTPQVRLGEGAARVRVRTVDADALADAIAGFVKATLRELRNKPCAIEARVADNRSLDVLIGPDELIHTLTGGPEAPQAEGLSLERGGVGLTLVSAAVVLQAHDAFGWTTSGSRTTVGIRLPLHEERALQ